MTESSVSDHDEWYWTCPPTINKYKTGQNKCSSCLGTWTPARAGLQALEEGNTCDKPYCTPAGNREVGPKQGMMVPLS